MSSEVSKKLTTLVSKELEQLALKGSLTPVELETANKAVEFMTKLLKYDAMCERKENGEDIDPMEYSERSYRMPRMMSYGGPWMSYEGNNSYGMNSYGGNSYGNNGGRGGNSNNSYGGNQYGSYRNSQGQYSGHSIKDRMIDRLERMMNEAETEYERKEIMEEISRIRQNSYVVN